MTDFLSHSTTLQFESWSSASQALILALSTFVQEDIPVISGALLAQAGRIPWLTAFLASCLGIWIGDALLYVIARVGGRRLLRWRIFQRFVREEAVARAEEWFAERGSSVLLLSRMVPGTRLPTYLAAGFLRTPFLRFLLITGIAVLLWVGGIYSVAFFLGDSVWNFVKGLGTVGWIIAFTFAILLIFGRRSPIPTIPLTTKLRGFLHRCTHWEFWPAVLFYAPVSLMYLWLALRHRGWTLPTAANPRIFSGGIVGESKFVTLAALEESTPTYTASSTLIAPGTIENRLAQLDFLRTEKSIQYPFVLKPDIGQRGVGVKIIRNASQTLAYLCANPAPLVLQEYVPGPFEIGVFYYRFPHEDSGRIFAITEKIFPSITGDGTSTIEQLVWSDPRARALAPRYLDRIPKPSTVLAPGEKLKLVETGNHAQGCIFRDGAHLHSEQLAQHIDEISRRLPGFFIGRYDIRFESIDRLHRGEFKILELNGAASEATSIYDARNSLASAYRTLYQQWRLVFAIGAANRALGHSPTSASLLWRKWRETTRLVTSYPLSD